jgi:hypothetical protein
MMKHLADVIHATSSMLIDDVLRANRFVINSDRPGSIKSNELIFFLGLLL